MIFFLSISWWFSISLRNFWWWREVYNLFTSIYSATANLYQEPSKRSVLGYSSRQIRHSPCLCGVCSVGSEEGLSFWFVFLIRQISTYLETWTYLLEFLLFSSSYNRRIDPIPPKTSLFTSTFGFIPSHLFPLSPASSSSFSLPGDSIQHRHLLKYFSPSKTLSLTHIPLSSYCSIPLCSFITKLLLLQKIFYAWCIWGWKQRGCIWNSCECHGRELISDERHFPER